MKTSPSNDSAQPILAANLEAERCVLGAMITDGEILRAVLDSRIRAEHFCLSDHRRICEAIERLVQRGTPVDFVTVAEESEKNQDKGNVYALMTDWTFGIVLEKSHILQHAAIVRNKALLRRLQSFGSDLADVATDAPDAKALLAKARQALEAIVEAERA